MTKLLGTEITIGGIRLKSNVLMAPLAGYTCFPFRLMVERLWAGSALQPISSASPLPPSALIPKDLRPAIGLWLFVWPVAGRDLCPRFCRRDLLPQE